MHLNLHSKILVKNKFYCKNLQKDVNYLKSSSSILSLVAELYCSKAWNTAKSIASSLSPTRRFAAPSSSAYLQCIFGGQSAEFLLVVLLEGSVGSHKHILRTAGKLHWPEWLQSLQLSANHCYTVQVCQ